VEAGLVDALRACAAWMPELSLVATTPDGTITGHVVCTRATVGATPVLGLGPLGVLPALQRQGVGHALMHAVLAAADALGEPLVVLLGHTDYYPLFGFRPAEDYRISPPVAEMGVPFPGPHSRHLHRRNTGQVRVRPAFLRHIATRGRAL
jgi:putative acetyltransferase